jgi:hypothetical protein
VRCTFNPGKRIITTDVLAALPLVVMPGIIQSLDDRIPLGNAILKKV